MKFCRQSKIHNVNKYTIITFYTNREKTWDRIRDNEQKSDKNSNPNERKKKIAMNGEMHQICCIVAAGKRALQYGEPIQYTPAQYENAITFSCLPGKLFSETKRCIAPRIETWFEFLQSKGLQDIALACPTDVTDKTILGFSNTTESSVLCFYQSGETSYFAPNWQFDPEKRLWNTEYSE